MKENKVEVETEVMNKVDQYIQQMADSLGVATDYMMDVLVKQSLIEGAISGGLFVFFTAVIITTIIIYTKKTEVIDLWLRRSGMREVIEIVAVIFIVVYLIVSVIFFTAGLGALINPEYYALKEILDTIAGDR